MKFSIRRTSHWNAEQPCSGAKRENFTRIDTRTVDHPDKLTNKATKDNWFKNGENHRVENGNIKRDFTDSGWFIEINTLEELLDLHKRNGDLVISESYYNDEMIEIQIYDDYRE